MLACHQCEALHAKVPPSRDPGRGRGWAGVQVGMGPGVRAWIGVWLRSGLAWGGIRGGVVKQVIIRSS